jgi:cardiolipin synthase
VQIFEYTAAALHAKVVRVDERWATVGSSNLDPLSLLVNFEANLAVRDGAFVQEVARHLEQAFGQAHAVSDTPVAAGWAAVLRRRAVALLARLYLRVAGVRASY